MVQQPALPKCGAQRVRVTAVLLIACLGLVLVGCGLLGDSKPPAQPKIEAIGGEIPAELARQSWVRQYWPENPPRLVARLRLRNGSFLHLSDWDEQPRCRLVYVADADGTHRRYSTATCGLLPLGDPTTDRILDVRFDKPDDGFSPRITTGTVDSSIEELRITFTNCGSRSYLLEGPIVPSKPTRRVFLLDMGKCTWGKVQAQRGGRVIDTLELYPAAD